MIHDSAKDRKTSDTKRRIPPPSTVTSQLSRLEPSGNNSLRHRVGNQGLQRLMGDIAAPSLRVAPLRSPAPSVQETPAGSSAASIPKVQRLCAECEEEQQKEAAGEQDRRSLQTLSVQETGTVQRAFQSDDSHNLESERFRGDEQLENIFDGKQEQFLCFGASGEAVVKVQQTLIDLGLSLPKFGADGRFGDETGSAVSKFKAQNGISPSDPVVGSKTIAALDAELVKQLPAPACVDGPINMEAEPLPSIPLPSITRMNANDLFELAKNRQVRGGHLPKFPPLGATIPKIENMKPVSVRVEPVASENCVKCIADWEVPQPKVEIFIAVGDFSAEPRRSFPVQDQSASGCPFETGGTFKDVIKRILPEAEPMILNAELEHWSDFVLTHLLITGRYLSNVRRLTPARTHLRGKDLADCANKVNQFLFDTTTFQFPLAIPFYGALSGHAVSTVHSATTQKREDAHSAVSVPPIAQKPVFPNIDNQINPFTCRAFFRKFDKTILPGLPGPPFSSIVKDKERFIPPRQLWNRL